MSQKLATIAVRDADDDARRERQLAVEVGVELENAGTTRTTMMPISVIIMTTRIAG